MRPREERVVRPGRWRPSVAAMSEAYEHYPAAGRDTTGPRFGKPLSGLSTAGYPRRGNERDGPRRLAEMHFAQSREI